MADTPGEIADQIVNQENIALVEANREFWKQRIEQAIAVAVANERERCARIAEAEEQRYRKGGPASSVAEDVWGANAAKQVAEAIRDGRIK